MHWKPDKLVSISLLLFIWQIYYDALASHALDVATISNKLFLASHSLAFWILFFGIAILSSLIWLSKKVAVAVCYLCIS